MKTVLKILSALAAIAGIIYVIAAYGDKLVSTCKKLLAWFSDERGATVVIESDFVSEPAKEPSREGSAQIQEETPAEDPASEETSAADGSAPVAAEEDFEG